MKTKHHFLSILFLLLVGTLSAQQVSPIKLEPFFQEIKTDIHLPVEDKNVLKLFKVRDTIVALSPHGIYKYAHGAWSNKASNTPYLSAVLDSEDMLWLLTDGFLQDEDGSTTINLPDQISGDAVLSLLWEEDALHLGTTIGMFTFKNDTWQQERVTKGKNICSMALDKDGILWVATNNGLLKRTPEEWQNLDEVLMASGTEEMYFDLHIPSGTTDLIFSAPYSLGCIASNGDHWMWSGKDGLPYGPVTTIRTYDDILWFGTDKGAARKDQNWRYYLGKRWLPDNKINDILPLNEHRVWIATPKGISQIQEVEMDLEEKAVHYERIIEKRHNRLGLINFSHLEIPGDISTSQTKNQDNDGLWTSTYLAAECFRYGVTQSKEARKKAIRTFEALEKLETVTGIPGLPARSYARSSDPVEESKSPHPKRWRPSPDSAWQWLDDCSSDEVVGHLFALSIFYDLVADGEMKERVEALVHQFINTKHY